MFKITGQPLDKFTYQPNENEDDIEFSGWNTEIYKDEVVDDDIKQLGIKYKIDLKKNASFMTYSHWRMGSLKDNHNWSKRKVAQMVATCWSPLNEVGPILTCGKLAISNLWKLQKFLADELKKHRDD